MEKPTECDPSGTSECFFTSTKISIPDMSLIFELSGNSTGYIAMAAGVSSNVSQVNFRHKLLVLGLLVDLANGAEKCPVSAITKITGLFKLEKPVKLMTRKYLIKISYSESTGYNQTVSLEIVHYNYFIVFFI